LRELRKRLDAAGWLLPHDRLQLLVLVGPRVAVDREVLPRTPGQSWPEQTIMYPPEELLEPTLVELKRLRIPSSARTHLPIPPTLEHLVLACLAKPPEDRPQSARQLAQSLDTIEGPPWSQEEAGRWWSRHHPLPASPSDAVTL
jgi:hypothetical protein